MFMLQMWEKIEGKTPDGRLVRQSIPRVFQSEAHTAEAALAEGQDIINREARNGCYMEMTHVVENVVHWDAESNGVIGPTVEVAKAVQPIDGDTGNLDMDRQLAQLTE